MLLLLFRLVSVINRILCHTFAVTLRFLPPLLAPATRTLLARDFLTSTTDASAPGPTEPPNLLLSHERLSLAAKELGMEAWQLQHILFKHGFVS